MNNSKQINLAAVKSHKDNLLLAEIAALLHDIGKCRGDFVRQQSKDQKPAVPGHNEIDKFLPEEIITLFRHCTFKITPTEPTIGLYELITEHHGKHHGNSDSHLVQLLRQCDHLDSADDKGIVRRKQLANDTVISSPFGFPKEKIDLDCFDCRFRDLQKNLIRDLREYKCIRECANGDSDKLLEELRDKVIEDIRLPYSHALGETRIPANDVTLWDHSYSTASLYKSLLCQDLINGPVKPENSNWRLYGIFWDGIGFIENSYKIADIEARKQIIEEMQRLLRYEFEVEYPIGNAIYCDLNGVIFTFPGLEDEEAIQLAMDCCEKSWEIVMAKSGQEVFPYFILSSRSRRVAKVIGEMLDTAGEQRTILKSSPFLIACGREKQLDVQLSRILPQNEENKDYDVCPECKIRAKRTREDACKVCGERRAGRLNSWRKGDRRNTIWIGETADVNNRVALLTLRLGLSDWLNGTLVRTIYSQTFEDWFGDLDNRMKSDLTQVSKLRDDIKNKVNGGFMTHRDAALQLLRIVLEGDSNVGTVGNDVQILAPILNSFYSGVSVNGKTFESTRDNLKKNVDNPTPETVLSALFTQNPSPARLQRIWKEAEEFWDITHHELVTQLGEWDRLRFELDSSKLPIDIQNNRTYVLQFLELEPNTLEVLSMGDSNDGSWVEFLTIESLDKFKFNEDKGVSAVKKAIQEGTCCKIADEDSPQARVEDVSSKLVVRSEPISEKYSPIIEVVRTPMLFQIIVPANESVAVLNTITNMYNARFARVMGKLPLNAGLLVANRKFPLYLLLETGRRMLSSTEFQEQVPIDPWWDITKNRNDEFYGYYPTTKIKENTSSYTLDELDHLSKGKPFFLYPGYFDFNLIEGNEDRHVIAYKDKKRIDERYRVLSSRPCYFYQYVQMVDLWEILTNNISTSQIHFIDEALREKRWQWRSVEDAQKEDVFYKYACSVILDAFGERWDNLSEETQGFILNSIKNNRLLDTIDLFKHVTKIEEVF